MTARRTRAQGTQAGDVPKGPPDPLLSDDVPVATEAQTKGKSKSKRNKGNIVPNNAGAEHERFPSNDGLPSIHLSTANTPVPTSSEPSQASLHDGVPRSPATPAPTSPQRVWPAPVPFTPTASRFPGPVFEHLAQASPLLDSNHSLARPTPFDRPGQGTSLFKDQLPAVPEMLHQSTSNSQSAQQVSTSTRRGDLIQSRELERGQNQAAIDARGQSERGPILEDFSGFTSSEDDGQRSLSKGSDTEYTGPRASHTQSSEAPKELSRSPKKYLGTIFTDFLTGLKGKSDLTFGELVQIGITIAKKPPEIRHKTEVSRLSELFADCNIAMAVMDGVRASITETGSSESNASSRPRTQKKKGATSEHEGNNDVDPFDDMSTTAAVGGGVSSAAPEYDISDKFLEGRIGRFGKTAEGDGSAKVAAGPDQTRFPHGYAPTTSLRNAPDTQIETGVPISSLQGSTEFAHADDGFEHDNARPMPGRASNTPLPVPFNNMRSAVPPPSRSTNPLPMTLGNPSAKNVNQSFRAVSTLSARAANPLPTRINSAPPPPRNADPRAKPAARRTNTTQATASMPLFADCEDDVEEDAPTRNKRRPRHRKPRKKDDNQPGEFFNLDGNGAEEEEEEEEVNDHRLGYYRGETKKLVVRAVLYMRLFLLNIDAFPAREELMKWADKSFSASCQVAFGINYKDRMPPFTDGLSTLLQNEGWGVRGKVKKAAAKLIDKFYDIFPPGNKYARYPNADELETRHIEQRVKTLLGAQTLYLRGYVPSQGEEVPYAHPAIKELIHVLVFSKKASKKPLAEQDLDAFSPIPLPLMAYACTALLNGLEEYQTGQLVKKDFSEADYGNYYKIMLANLSDMDRDESSSLVLQDIREDIFNSGCRLLSMSVHDEYQRPPAPFVPSAPQNNAHDGEF